jgi:cell filamentation protein
MARTSGNRRDKYDVSGNVEAQFADDKQLVLADKPGLVDLASLQWKEEVLLARAYSSLLSEVRNDTRMTCELLKHIHLRIFGELFEWAGRWRTVTISKGNAIWPPPRYLDQAMTSLEDDFLNRWPASALHADEDFSRAVGEIQGEFLAIHPFREGNARTIKLMSDLLAAQSDRPPLAYDMTEAGQNRYIDAARVALARKDYGPIIAEALDRAESSPLPSIRPSEDDDLQQ